MDQDNRGQDRVSRVEITGQPIGVVPEDSWLKLLNADGEECWVDLRNIDSICSLEGKFKIVTLSGTILLVEDTNNNKLRKWLNRRTAVDLT